MSAELTLRCVLGGILAVVLLHFGLVSDGLLPAMAALDPDAAPAAFYGANLLLLAASLCVGFPVLRDGLTGLRGRPSADTMPALAAAAALLQAVTANAERQCLPRHHGHFAAQRYGGAGPVPCPAGQPGDAGSGQGRV